MGGGLVMMILFFAQDRRDRGGGIGIRHADIAELSLQMSQYDALDSHGGSGNEAGTHQPRHQTERIAAEAAHPIAATTRQSPSFQFIGKDGSMPLFMGFELGQLGQ